ncbi:ABC transporter ATP-binding protein [Escherichia coli]|uniref:ABC transporter ATP-binding protein n=1 Tax=Escherichia coli TaxID=562 RepID=UPI000F89C853|nr:ABC transporter ATP-binding protein [Escherichia coli]MEB2472306.1 ABC transporter ATP-binding protein [Escherichia coli]HCA4490501.1 ABC transporter ATP-binding protein [Escherichia coli]HCA4585366.1 ABC transporter ATP-binding protein [Escherichia coli]
MISIDIKKKKFEDKCLLKNISITIERNGFYVITGPSGVGKSTLLYMLGLLDTQYEGAYRLNNKYINTGDTISHLLIRKKYFGFVFQNSLINPNQSVLRNLLCSVDYSQLKVCSKHVDKIMDMVGLSGVTEKAAVLSGGEKQRLALARALIKKPKVIFADEPTASLDKNNKKLVMNILKNYQNTGGTVIMVTHDLELIDSSMKLIQLYN